MFKVGLALTELPLLFPQLQVPQRPTAQPCEASWSWSSQTGVCVAPAGWSFGNSSGSLAPGAGHGRVVPRRAGEVATVACANGENASATTVTCPETSDPEWWQNCPMGDVCEVNREIGWDVLLGHSVGL